MSKKNKTKPLTPERMAIRKALFTPCRSKEELDRWVRFFLNIRFPDQIVSDESNMSPLTMLWTLYDKLVRNDTKGWKQTMVYASRFSGKTLAAAVLEVLVLLHTERNIVHMAAIKDQSDKAQEYVKGFFFMPELREWKSGDNDREVVVVAYKDPDTGFVLTEKEWEELEPTKQARYRRKKTYVRIIVCTMQSTNGQHVELLCVSGDTKIAVMGGVNRERTSVTAKGLYRALAGLSPTGRYPEAVGSFVPTQTVEVVTFDWVTGVPVFRPIVFATARESDTITVATSKRQLRASPNHQVWCVERGAMVPVSELSVGERIAVLNRGKMGGKPLDVEPPYSRPFAPVDGEEWYQVLIGSLLGDGGVYRRPGNNAFFQERHSEQQSDYLRWKASVLGRHLRIISNPGKSGFTGEPQPGIRSGNTPMLNGFETFKTDLNGVDRLSALGLAVWYSDDGHASRDLRISTCGFTADQNKRLAEVLKNNFGIEVEPRQYDGYWYLCGNTEAKRKLVEVCAPHVHPSMAHKFDIRRHVGKCKYCSDEYWYYERNGVTCNRPVCLALQSGKLLAERIESIEVDPSKTIVYDFTVDGSNNFLTNGIISHNCVDEVDVIPKGNLKAYDQAKNGVPTDFGDMEAMTLFTSTRKSRIGKVQQELDNASRSGLQVGHWNIIDITEPCKPERHRPDEPQQTYWINDANVTHITDGDYQALPESEKSKWYAREGFAGCRTCPLFAACKGRLATHQNQAVFAGKYKDGGTALLLKIDTVISKFVGATPEFITTEFLCRKPDTSGLVYPRFNEAVHKLTAAQIAEKVTGHTVDPNLTKSELHKILVDAGVRFVLGIDWGYTHLFAVVLLAVWGNTGFIVDAIGLPQQELDDQLALVEPFRKFNPIVFADTARNDNIATFKKRGWKMRDWTKGAGTVKGGVEIVRAKLWTKDSGPTLYFLKDDPTVEMLCSNLRDYHFTTDVKGDFTETPDETNDDLPDALRYAIMNTFAKNGALVSNLGLHAVGEATKELHWTEKVARENSQFMTNTINALTGKAALPQIEGVKVKKPGFFADM